MVPVAELPPPTPSTDHVTAVSLVPCTTAVNCCCAPAWTMTEASPSWIVTNADLGGGVVPLLDFVLAQPTKGRMNARTTRYFENEDSVVLIQRVVPASRVCLECATIDVTSVRRVAGEALSGAAFSATLPVSRDPRGGFRVALRATHLVEST